jgi:hypothetical protein
MLMAIPASRSTLVKLWLVNCQPWSVLKTSGLPYRAIASSSASTRKSASMVIDSRQDSTRRPNQSMTAAK